MPVTTISPPHMMVQANRLLRWWFDELSALWSMLPIKQRSRQAKCHIFLEADCVVVDRIVGNQAERFVEQLPFQALDEHGQAELRALTDGAVTTLLLAPPLCYAVSLNLPKIPRARVASAVDLQMPFIAPVPPELLSWSITDIAPAEGGFRVTVVMAKRSTLDAIHAVGVDGENNWPIAPASAPDRPFRDYQGERTGNGWIGAKLHWLGFSILALLSIPLSVIVAGTLLIGRVDSQADVLRDQAADTRTALRSALNLEEQRRALMPLFARPDAASLLNELAMRLPPSDWLRSAAKRSNGALQFIVSTSDDAALDRSLRQSEMLIGVHVVDETPSGEGRTDITYETDPL